MYKRFMLALALLTFASEACATNVHLTWTVAAGATTPATSYRIEELIGGTWGNLAGASGPTMATGTARQLDVTTTTTNPSLSLIPIANGKDGTRSNKCTAVGATSDEVVTVTCVQTN